jgi:voltage-gated potassium channel
MLFFKKFYYSALKQKYKTLILFTILFIFINSWIMNKIEPETFENIYHATWWLLTTMTTVGYGDVSPQTVLGRTWAMFVVFTLGIGTFGFIIGAITELLSKHKKLKEEGRLMYKGENHFVVIGWTAKSKIAIKELLVSQNHIDIVLIDELEKTPVEDSHIHYIQGSPTDFETLKKAKIEDSKAVLIFAPQGIEDANLADGKTLIIASSIESYDNGTEKNIYTIAEILDGKHVDNFRHVKIDEFILSQESVSLLMAKSAQTKGSSHLFTQLLSQQDGEDGCDLWQVKGAYSWKTYGEAYEALKEKGATLIADRNQLNLLSKYNDPLPSEAVLFVICDKKTYLTL